MNPAETLRMIERHTQPAARIGTVTTGGPTPVVALDGAGSITVQYVAQGLSLSATDRVLAVRTAGGAWVVTDKLTTPAAVTPPVVRRFTPTKCWVKGTQLDDGPGEWNSQLEYVGLGLNPQIWQGQDTSQAGSDSYGSPQNLLKYATVLYWGSLASLMPSLSTVLDVSVTFTRELPFNARTQPPLTYPRLYGSAYSQASPPAPSDPPSAVVGPLTPSVAVAPGQSTTIGLPASWVTDWLAGTITSLHFFSDQRSDIIRSLDAADDVQLIVTYYPPEES